MKNNIDINPLSPFALRHYAARAGWEFDNGSSIEINNLLPYIYIERYTGEEYEFKGNEAQNLLDQVPPNINSREYLLALSTEW